MISANSQIELDFNNTKVAFQNKSDKELEKAFWLFKMVANNTLIKVGTPLTTFALKIGLPIQGIIRNTIYKQFCGGESIEGCAPAITELGRGAVTTILDYSVEGEDSEESFEQTCEEILKTVAFAKNNSLISFCVFKPTGLGRFDLFAKVDAKQRLTDSEKTEFDRVYERIDRICRACHDAGIKVLVDAEHSWIQDTIDDFAREMMEKYNQERPVVYNTYQLYRNDKLASLKADFAYAQTQNFYLGAKIVRGAYMEIERERAAEKGYPSPIQPNKQASDVDYNEAILFCLDHINRIGLMAGTHNEESSRLLAEEMIARGISPKNEHVFFAQLLGMSDNLSFNLANAGFNVAKYMPYGPVKAVMPYLFRRAQENTSVGGQTGRELGLIMKEKARRKAQK
ncbi:proline dehydrogenase family protein [Sphingobacterium suaedae]|uniref:Proline dehydrogenase family protein n=1 Tax=Sphingobacterium suaedae TaxID=1686402 RepID=A0ABW5KHM9_9SPHI